MPVDYEVSRQLCEQHATSFYAAAQFLPHEKRNAAYALYGYCRYTDNILDREESREIKRKKLQTWKELLQKQWDATEKNQSILQVFVETCKEYKIPQELGFALIEGLENDLKKDEYADFDELY